MQQRLETQFIGLSACGRICAAIFIGLLLAACQPQSPAPTPTPQPPAPNVIDAKSVASNLVRGYLAVAVGRSAQAESSGGLYAREVDAKTVHLPNVEVYLQDLATQQAGVSVRTDLSGRFTLQAPATAKYKLCWKSGIYGDGCHKADFGAGSKPVFLSTILIPVPHKDGFVATYGKVRFSDDSLPRTLEPLSDINAYATVTLLDEQKKEVVAIPVNNFGDYVLPYMPSKAKAFLVASIEKARTIHDVHPDNYLKNPRLAVYNLTIANTPPRLDAIVPRNAGGKRMQLANPGDTIVLKANARDRDGDPLKVQWTLLDGSGALSSATAAQTQWTLPAAKGRYAAMATVSDGKGGYAQYTVRMSAGAAGVAFGGLVAGTDGTLLDGAEVEINGKVEKTDAAGRFLSFVPESERYVFNIRKPGYGFYSRVYDRSVAGGRWTLTTATMAEFDPALEINLQDKRSGRNCPGPDSARINWKERPNLTQVWWQDGKGNNVAPPVWFNAEQTAQVQPTEKTVILDDKAVATVKPAVDKRPAPKPGRADSRKENRTVILPWQPTRWKHGECGPGMSVKIPAHGLQAEDGSAPTGPVVVSLATVDLETPEQMPGEGAVVRPGGFGWIQSFGAGSVEIREKASGKRLNLKLGVEAEVFIPVDRASLAVSAPLPASAPLLYYDESTGIWKEEGKLTLDAGGKNYVAKVKHFSTLNTDVTFDSPSCLRVESTIPTPYDLEVRIPLPGGAAPKLKKITITDAPPHVIYSLPNFTNVTLTAIAPGSGSVPPRVLGVFVVNTGAPQAGGYSPPPPPTACATTVTLSTQTFPDQPNSGEFLHGLFSFAATVVNEADILTPGSLSQQLDQATLNYYAQIDPPSAGHPNGERFTLDDFKTKNGFNTGTSGFQLCGGNVCDNPDQEVNVVFANSGDLGFGRDMHCRRTDTGGGSYDYACYVTNYGDITTDDALDAANARNNSGVVATVAMEYSRIQATDAANDRHVKFYVYNAAGNRINNADLDSGANIRRRPIPQLCMVCHGGAYPGGGTTGVPVFNTPDSVKLGSRFLPFDLRFYTFPASPDKAAQQAAVKKLNLDIVKHAPGSNAINEVVDAMYDGVANQKEEFAIAGWKQAQLPNTAAQEGFYKRVVGNACRTCHVAQPFEELQFRSAQSFLGGGYLSAAEQRVCVEHVMPHAKRTHDIFWGQYWQNSFGAISPTLPGEFQAFGDTMKNLPAPAGWVGPWPPAWSGEVCGAYTPGGAASPPSYYSTLVHLLWSRNYNGGTCAGCHSSIFTGSANTVATGLVADGYIAPNNEAGSLVLQKVLGTAPGARMPQGCPNPPNSFRCLNEGAGYNAATDSDPNSTTHEINRIRHWIQNGATP